MFELRRCFCYISNGIIPDKYFFSAGHFDLTYEEDLMEGSQGVESVNSTKLGVK